MPEGSTVLTTEFKINLLAPARGEMMRACAEVIKPGRTLVIVRSEVYCSAGGSETHVATALVTTMCLKDAPQLKH
jgi:acyl-coenzyme A thioesterase PaaI-like protein